MAKRFNIFMSVVAIGTCLIAGFQLLHAPASAAPSTAQAMSDSNPSQSTQAKLTGPSKTVLEY